MRRRQLNAQRAQEVAVTITQPMKFIPVPDGDGMIAGRETCPKCGKVMKPQGRHNHVRFCKGTTD